ncbi:hypothetical protein PHYSODRAFT_532919 [Phytophthora sojae]|uniref:Protein kinase domain-containing protein n=1 Tax=Phytophthora sojae (strain P6497) TaxID=1094619 RepID=G5AER2_PHYSP|nr:hypothetical protein PHYSODRAFT_532919 [Phytophthora sojae]EGZ05702.1 hypothetical protein PHYSODRAFT_532919 [Phytophthora sojae]|eukprot:XP_009538563.1 hypothetical protein PHYSODRAFT_532919 [Phytophthora sojae]
MFGIIIVAVLLGRAAATVDLLATSYFVDENCMNTPQIVTMDFTVTAVSSCVSDASCTPEVYGGNTYYSKSECITDPYTYSVEIFNGNGGVLQPFLMVETYTGEDCETLSTINATATANGCQFASENSSSSATLFTNGSALYQLYDNGACGGNATRYFVDRATLLNHTCYGGNTKFYTNYDASTSSNSASASGSESTSTSSSGSNSSVANTDARLTAGAIVGIIIGSVALVFFVAAVVFWRSRLSSSKDTEDTYADYRAATNGRPTMSSDPNSQDIAPHGLGGLWDDEVIATARIPREKVVVQHLLSRGAYGEVYAGLYNGQLVAIKMLLQENRRSVRHLNEFLAEVKRTALLDHPRIVRLVGVAWDSLTDLCGVLEYMEGGDLRALLDKLNVQGHHKGFDQEKVRIALHVAHALTYLHSLDLPVIHRDLKSKNILLSEDLDAKLTDFGVSRERINETMTAGVGTSLWMAPEVMMGEKYDAKADIFSFGVVLSELDTHCLPYDNARKKTNKSDAAILQLVAAGKIHVEFSPWALQSMVNLGLACVSVDSKLRPTAAEALYKLHTILSQEV